MRTNIELRENVLVEAVLDAAFEIHRRFGPGLLESVYEALLCHLLRKKGLSVQRQVAVNIEFDGVILEEGFRMDLLVDDLLIVEIKSVESLNPVYSKQLLTYLRLTNKRLGLLLNFNETVLRTGIERVANGLLSA